MYSGSASLTEEKKITYTVFHVIYMNNLMS